MGTRMSEWPLVTIRSSLGCFTCQLGRIQPIYIRGYYNLLILSTSSIVTWIISPRNQWTYWPPLLMSLVTLGLPWHHQLQAPKNLPRQKGGILIPSHDAMAAIVANMSRFSWGIPEPKMKLASWVMGYIRSKR